MKDLGHLELRFVIGSMTLYGEEVLRQVTEMAGVELLGIGAQTSVSDFKKELRWNQAWYRLSEAL